MMQRPCVYVCVCECVSHTSVATSLLSCMNHALPVTRLALSSSLTPSRALALICDTHTHTEAHTRQTYAYV